MRPEHLATLQSGYRILLECAIGGEQVRNAAHIHATDSRHGQLKGFLRRCRGTATKYLDKDLRWFQQVDLDNASHVPRQRNRQVMHAIWKLSHEKRQ